MRKSLRMKVTYKGTISQVWTLPVGGGILVVTTVPKDSLVPVGAVVIARRGKNRAGSFTESRTIYENIFTAARSVMHTIEGEEYSLICLNEMKGFLENVQGDLACWNNSRHLAVFNRLKAALRRLPKFPHEYHNVKIANLTACAQSRRDSLGRENLLVRTTRVHHALLALEARRRAIAGEILVANSRRWNILIAMIIDSECSFAKVKNGLQAMGKSRVFSTDNARIATQLSGLAKRLELMAKDLSTVKTLPFLSASVPLQELLASVAGECRLKSPDIDSVRNCLTETMPLILEHITYKFFLHRLGAIAD